jgi:hypothetical protein
MSQVATRPLPQWQTAAKEVPGSLAFTSAAFLVDESPLTSTHRLPPFVASPISLMRNLKRKYALSAEEPRNEREVAYQIVLLQSKAREAQSKVAFKLLGTQSTIVLEGMFCKRLSSQLAGQLNGDGLPRLLTGENCDRVAEHEKTRHWCCGQRNPLEGHTGSRPDWARPNLGTVDGILSVESGIYVAPVHGHHRPPGEMASRLTTIKCVIRRLQVRPLRWSKSFTFYFCQLQGTRSRVSSCTEIRAIKNPSSQQHLGEFLTHISQITSG